jgi:hypothetical protein
MNFEAGRVKHDFSPNFILSWFGRFFLLFSIPYFLLSSFPQIPPPPSLLAISCSCSNFPAHFIQGSFSLKIFKVYLLYHFLFLLVIFSFIWFYFSFLSVSFPYPRPVFAVRPCTSSVHAPLSERQMRMSELVAAIGNCRPILHYTHLSSSVCCAPNIHNASRRLSLQPSAFSSRTTCLSLVLWSSLYWNGV